MKQRTIMDYVLLAFSVLLALGVKVIFHACPVGEMVMSCHHAENAVCIAGIVLSVLALVMVLVPKYGLRKILSIVMIPVSIVAAVLPGGIIHLCMMKDMRCHSVMRPAVIIFSVIIIICAVINIVLNERKKSDE